MTTQPAGPLENYANNSSPPSPRRRRYARRGLLWEVSSLARVRKCGRVSVVPGGGVAVRLRGEGAGYAGLATCGSVWADPVCNAKVMSRRAVEVGVAVSSWQQAGGQVIFSTFTMRHHLGQSLPALWSALSSAWGKVTSGKGWLTDKRRHGIAGWLRVVEVTHGANGWHVHVHALLFVEPMLGVPAVETLHGSMFGRWSSRLIALGLSAPLMIGQDSHLVTDAADSDLAGYFTKATDSAHAVGLEVTQSQTKASRLRHKTRTPWGLLDDVEHLGLADSLDLWREWERGSKGRKQMTWSKGVRDRLGLLREQSDEEIAEQELGSAADDLVLIDSAGWSRLREVPGDLADVLTVTESGGLAALRSYLNRRQITYKVLGDRE